MKLTQKLLRLMLMLAISWSVVGCSDDKTPDGPVQNGPYVKIDLIKTSAREVSVAFIPMEVNPSMYAYQVFEASEAPEAMSGNDVFKNGVQAPVSSSATIINDLKPGTEYRIFAVAMSETGVTRANSLDFATSPATDATDDGIGIEVTSLTDRAISYKLTKGKNVTAGRVLLYAKVLIDNRIEDMIAEYENAGLEGITRDEALLEIVTDDLVHLTTRVQGDEAIDYAGLIMPDLDYYIITLGLTGDAEEFTEKENGDLSILTVSTLPSELNPAVEAKLEEAKCSFNQGNWKVWISGATFGYMRFITNTEEIETYYKRGHTDKELSDFVRATDYLMLMQNRSENDVQGLTIDPSDNSATRYETQNFNAITGFPGAKLTCLVVGVDENYMSNGTVLRVDTVLPEKPDHCDARVEIEVRDITATGCMLDFIFNEDCATCYYNFYPAGTFEREYKDQPDNQKLLLTELITNGDGATRILNSPDSPVNPMYTEMWHNWLDPDTEYEMIATCRDFIGLVQEELWVSKPFRSKPLINGGSKFKLKAEAYNIGRDSFGVRLGLDPESVEASGEDPDYALNVAYVKVQRASEAAPSSGAALRNENSDIWNWVQKYGGNSWSMTRPGFECGCDSYFWSMAFDPDTDYVVYATAEDRDGHILDMLSLPVKTLPKTVGKNPRVTQVSLTNLTTKTLDYTVAVNDQTDYAKYVCVAQDSGWFTYDPESSNPDLSSEQTLIDDLTFLIEQGQGMNLNSMSISMTVTSSVHADQIWYIAAIAYGALDEKGNPYTHFDYASATTPKE